ncbi:MAG: site-2 protease family protein [Scytonematopsis contorta HA4267-MV1]|jgi:Zn-dependent protease|nr:site-2 protease family protein [Scytonematopsis contorta HA4267-MV1]
MFLEHLIHDPVYFFRIVVITILSITLHELAHGLAAISQGDDTPQRTGHMTLNPVVHMGWESIIFLCLTGLSWGQMPVNPSKFRNGSQSNVIVSAAGPLCNLALALLFIFLIKISSAPGIGLILSSDFLYLAARMNLILCIFNFLPIPPLDGYHVFSESFPALRELERNRMGMFFLMVIFLIPGFGFILAFIADFIIRVLA